MSQKTELPGPSDTVIPINKAVAGNFAKAAQIGYAHHDNGSLYISNGHFIMKADQAEFDGMLEHISKRLKANHVTPAEIPAMLKYIDGGRGKFELTGEPLEFESGDHFISLFADEKQYFGYDKKYVDIFKSGDNLLFVDDNAGFNTNTHNMIVKSPAGEVLGVVLPLRLSEELYGELADVLPLKFKWKTEYERIKENPTHDPYIGKEYFDGTDTHIIARTKEIDGENMYVVPRVMDGKVSGYAAYVKVDEIKKKIARWEEDRTIREKDHPAPPAEKEKPPAQEESKTPARPFTYLRKSPWGEVTACEKLCPGVFMVSTDKQGGIMVARDMTAALSPAAVKCGSKYKEFLCFENNGAKDVALRELLDKKLWAAPVGAKEKAACEENINKSLRERQPEYWRSRENTRVHTPPAKTAPAHER